MWPVRVSDGQTVFPAGSSEAVVLDASAPTDPVIDLTGRHMTHEGGDMEVGLESEDEHSGVAGYELAVGYGEGPVMLAGWREASAFSQLSIPTIPEEIGRVFVFARAKNGAGLNSDISAAAISITPDMDDDDDQGDDDTFINDDDSDGDETDTSSDDDDDDGRCCG